MPFAWKSYHSSHAIQQVSATFNVKDAITDPEQWALIIKEAYLIASEWKLNEVKNHSTMEVNDIKVSDNEAYAVEFSNSNENSNETLTVRRDQIEFNSWNYIRWAGFISKIQSTLFKLSQMYVKKGSIFNTALIYADIFNSTDSDADATQVINKRSEYLPSKIIHPIENWKSDNKFFEIHEGNAFIKRFSVASINDPEPDDPEKKSGGIVRELRIYTSVSIFHQVEEETFLSQTLATSFEKIHTHSKNLLRSLITEEANKSITLGG